MSGDRPASPRRAESAEQDLKQNPSGYVERVIARARELRAGDAFEAPEGTVSMRISAARSKAVARAQRRDWRRVTLAFGVVGGLLAAFSLFLPYVGFDFMGIGSRIYSPQDVLDCYDLWFRMNVLPLFDPALANRTGQMFSEFAIDHPSGMYTLVMNRAAATVIVVLCGALLGVSGLLFQASFKNPLATPSMLGVSDGVMLGCIAYTLLGHTSIADDPKLYVLLVYGCGAAAVAFVILCSRTLSGAKRYNVLDMLLLGTVVAQLLSGIGSFVQNFIMDYDTWEQFYDVQQGADALSQPIVQLFAVAVFLLTMVPAIVLSFKMNLISFSDEEGRMMGVRAGLLRGVALLLGSAMQLAAMATVGAVAMLSLAVPFLVRYIMPADFRSQMVGNCLIGAEFLLACVVIQHFAIVDSITMPVGTIVSIFIVPFFIWMVAFGQGKWR